ncbi:hypothetical protein BU15DRAFT_60090 [Melanogaster broomeanus]|nr:hypothetical protein BU15DRAFT_60090 [Melanogaster broomeanus]
MAAMDIEMAYPVHIAVNYDQDHEYKIPAYQSEIDLCQLLQSMSLSKGKFKCKRARCKHGGLRIPFRRVGVIKLKVQLLRPTHTTESQLTSSIIVKPSRLPACHFLQSILASLAPESPVLSPSPYPYPVASFQTTNGAYLDTILTHRSLLSAFPPAHRGCAATLQEIARALELAGMAGG